MGNRKQEIEKQVTDNNFLLLVLFKQIIKLRGENFIKYWIQRN